MRRRQQEEALHLFFEDIDEACDQNEKPDLHKGHRGKRKRKDQPETADDSALRLWIMANSPARLLRVLAEYADQNAKDCNQDREFPAAGVWTQFAQETRKLHAWTLDFVELV